MGLPARAGSGMRSRGRAYTREDFENIIIVSRQDGSRVLLKDIARVKTIRGEKERQAAMGEG